MKSATFDPKTGEMTLVVQTGEPRASASGKTQSIAYLQSGTPTGQKGKDGRPILLNLNLYVK